MAAIRRFPALARAGTPRAARRCEPGDTVHAFTDDEDRDVREQVRERLDPIPQQQETP